jgi:hypothetical protein
MSKDPPILKDSGFSSDIVKYSHDSGRKSQVYDWDNVEHSVNCTCCTSIEESNLLEEKRQEWFKAAHKGRNERVRQRQRHAEARATDFQTIEQPKDSYNPLFMEDFDL